MSREADIYGQLCRSIAPSIFGSENVKKARRCRSTPMGRSRLQRG